MATNEAADKPVKSLTSLAPIEDDFVSLGTDRLFFNPEKCSVDDDGENVQLRGYAMEAVEYPPKGKNKDPWHAIVIRTTAPTKAVDGDEVVDVPAGEEVLIVATERLKKLIPFALHEEKVAEVIIDVIGKIDLPDNKTMWRYRTQISRKPRLRSELVAEMLGIAAPETPAALTE
jgi:hypothetical protein